jgi:hypothetical protein
LKEGLARGFESVGLVEDALVSYDELSVGLDAIVREQPSDGAEDQGSTILEYTEDLHQRALEILEQSKNDDESNSDQGPPFHEEKPINSQKKSYRDLILSNNISVFDFRSYVFARQMSLLLRLGNSLSARTDLAVTPRPTAGVIQRSVDDVNVETKAGAIANDSEDLLSLSELCTRALNFIPSAARLLREDLLNG